MNTINLAGDMINMNPQHNHMPQAASAEFTKNIDQAMGIPPEAAWPIIAELHSAHGYSAYYDLGVVCIAMVGLGVMYLVSINGIGNLGGIHHG